MIGTIADDFTGGTDVAVALRRAGLRTVIFFGQPARDAELPPHDAVVIALKSRTVSAADAVERSRSALRWLRDHGVDQVYFKFCSTFDSTPQGNIGPVLDALSEDLAAEVVVLTPSSPEHGRTQYEGDLYVGDRLLSESPMRHHPLTPMTDSNLLRLLGAQTEHRVDLVTLPTVRRGVGAVITAVERARVNGSRYVLVDALSESDLEIVGRAVAGSVLVAGAAGLAAGLATARSSGSRDGGAVVDPFADAPSAVLAGSCSARTLEQIRYLQDLDRPSYRLDALVQQNPRVLAAGALSWFDALDPGAAAPLIYSSLPPAQLREIQSVLGVDRASRILETATGLVARGLVARGVRRIVTAGGETSGAVVTALGVRGGLIGPEAARGVPWIYSTSPAVALLLKSGNFGEPDLLATASARVVAGAA